MAFNIHTPSFGKPPDRSVLPPVETVDHMRRKVIQAGLGLLIFGPLACGSSQEKPAAQPLQIPPPAIPRPDALPAGPEVIPASEKPEEPEPAKTALEQYFEKADRLLENPQFELPKIDFTPISFNEINSILFEQRKTAAEQVFFDAIKGELDQFVEKAFAKPIKKGKIRRIKRRLNGFLKRVSLNYFDAIEEKGQTGALHLSRTLPRILNAVLIPRGFFVIQNVHRDSAGDYRFGYVILPHQSKRLESATIEFQGQSMQVLVLDNIVFTGRVKKLYAGLYPDGSRMILLPVESKSEASEKDHEDMKVFFRDYIPWFADLQEKLEAEGGRKEARSIKLHEAVHAMIDFLRSEETWAQKARGTEFPPEDIFEPHELIFFEHDGEKHAPAATPGHLSELAAQGIELMNIAQKSKIKGLARFSDMVLEVVSTGGYELIHDFILAILSKSGVPLSSMKPDYTGSDEDRLFESSLEVMKPRIQAVEELHLTQEQVIKLGRLMYELGMRGLERMPQK